MTAAAPSRPMSAEEFESAYGHLEEPWELVEGVPAMPPFASFRNTTTAGALVVLLHERLGGRFLLAPHAGLHLPSLPGRGKTIRIPDLVVKDPARATDLRGDVTGVVLVAEVVSDGSVLDDLVVKRRQYAQAGIPGYLVVDVREAPARLWFFESPTAEGYPDPTGNGDSVTMHVGGQRVTLTAEDVTAFL